MFHKRVDRLNSVVKPINLLFHNPVLHFDVFDVLFYLFFRLADRFIRIISHIRWIKICVVNTFQNLKLKVLLNRRWFDPFQHKMSVIINVRTYQTITSRPVIKIFHCRIIFAKIFFPGAIPGFDPLIFEIFFLIINIYKLVTNFNVLFLLSAKI